MAVSDEQKAEALQIYATTTSGTLPPIVRGPRCGTATIGFWPGGDWHHSCRHRGHWRKQGH